MYITIVPCTPQNPIPCMKAAAKFLPAHCLFAASARPQVLVMSKQLCSEDAGPTGLSVSTTALSDSGV